MSAAPASFRARLAAGERLVGSIVTLPLAGVAEIVADAGFDWLWIDMEHGPLDLLHVEAMVRARGSSAAIVRAPANDPVWIKRILDTGCDGIILPHVSSAAEARAAVESAFYPPRGKRSFGVARAHGYGPRMNEYLTSSPHETAVLVQIESARAVENADEILATDGVDAAVIGPFDLSGSLGRLGDVGHPDVVAAIDAVASAGRTHGTPVGIFCGSADTARGYLARGFSPVAVGVDCMLLADAARSLRRSLDAGG
ncbi:MAG TPA: aldolase/citrate lyase family protein [Candidatus Binatia bacterium]|nr:aldolase/citrate lyase family protein [Candidatus Binatia bacterium]